MEKEFLSQNKKIYFVSKDKDGFHVAKRPVIYLNREYTYYKDIGNKLSYVMTGHVSDVLNLKEAERLCESYWDYDNARLIGMYWSVDDGVGEYFKGTAPQIEKQKIEKQKIEKRIEELRREISLNEAKNRDLNRLIDYMVKRWMGN